MSMPSVAKRTSSRTSSSGCLLVLRIQVIGSRRRIAFVADVQVGLRRRVGGASAFRAKQKSGLLQQPGGFQGFASVEVIVHMRHLPLTQRQDRVDALSSPIRLENLSG